MPPHLSPRLWGRMGAPKRCHPYKGWLRGTAALQKSITVTKTLMVPSNLPLHVVSEYTLKESMLRDRLGTGALFLAKRESATARNSRYASLRQGVMIVTCCPLAGYGFERRVAWRSLTLCSQRQEWASGILARILHGVSV